MLFLLCCSLHCSSHIVTFHALSFFTLPLFMLFFSRCSSSPTTTLLVFLFLLHCSSRLTVPLTLLLPLRYSFCPIIPFMLLLFPHYSFHLAIPFTLSLPLRCSSCHVIPFTMPLSLRYSSRIVACFRYLLAQILLFILCCHCYSSHIAVLFCLVSMVLPLSLPRASQSLGLRCQLEHQR